ncbi:MAG: ARMT1-like domain-containing protein [Candidatus Kaelpia aquatica]|nr:ARMT1-like domain-containing protein [Candidatus Kaelpia aquatica]
MNTYLDCIPCFFKQALESSRMAGADKEMQKKMLDEIAAILPSISLKLSPPEMGRTIYKLTNKLTGVNDPYLKIKEKSNKLALGVYDRLKERVGNSEDRLLMAVELAIAGNIIDYGVKNSLNVELELEKILVQESKVIKEEKRRLFDYPKFKKDLLKSKSILYLGDNAGEILFDRILIEEIKRIDSNKSIIFAVKEGPIINDALMKDALDCGIDHVADIISSGSDGPGTILSICSEKFLSIYRDVDMVISKGQGNFEALSDAKRDIFFLFIAKCPVIAQDVGARIGDVILIYHQGQEDAKKRSS